MNTTNRNGLFAHATAIGIDDVMKDDTQRHALIKEFSEGNYESVKDMPDEKVAGFIDFLNQKYPPPPVSLLPTTKTPPQVNLTSQVILAYGAKKIGKSTFCSHADRAVFAATEKGLNHLSVFQTPISTWMDFRRFCNEIGKGDHDFGTIVIDTIDNLFRMCSDHVCKKNGINHESDLGYGKGFALVNDAFYKTLNWLSLQPYGLIMVSHAKDKEIETQTGDYTRNVPSLPNRASEIVSGMADLILYFDFDLEGSGDSAKPKRVIRTKPTKYYDAGDRSGKLPETMDMDYNSFMTEYKKVMEKK